MLKPNLHAAGMQASPLTCLGDAESSVWKTALTGIILSGVALAAFGAPGVAEEDWACKVEEFAIPESLTGRPGDPAQGERVVRDANNVTCLICHSIPISGEPDPGNIGPPLQGVGSRYSAGELRLRIVDPKLLNPDSVMPSYYKMDGLHEVADEYRDQPIYSAQNVEDVVAYLLTLVEE